MRFTLAAVRAHCSLTQPHIRLHTVLLDRIERVVDSSGDDRDYTLINGLRIDYVVVETINAIVIKCYYRAQLNVYTNCS